MVQRTIVQRRRLYSADGCTADIYYSGRLYGFVTVSVTHLLLRTFSMVHTRSKACRVPRCGSCEVVHGTASPSHQPPCTMACSPPPPRPSDRCCSKSRSAQPHTYRTSRRSRPCSRSSRRRTCPGTARDPTPPSRRCCTTSARCSQSTRHCRSSTGTKTRRRYSGSSCYRHCHTSSRQGSRSP